MIDMFFAIFAAAVNTAEAQMAERPPEEPAAIATEKVAPADMAQPSTPSVAIGDNVQIGQGVIIGGNAQPAETPQTTTNLGAGIKQGAEIVAGNSSPATSPTQLTPVTPVAPKVDQSVIPAGLVADPQSPTGKFTTAIEVKPILQATRGNWVAVREYDGSDLLYVTHLWSWRCGLKAMAISINDEPLQNWPLPPCHEKFASPNALLEDDPLPFLKLKLGGVQKIKIQIVYDDLSTDVAEFKRSDVLMP